MKIACLNSISEKGTCLFGAGYEVGAPFEEADAALVRSASMHELELPQTLLAVARAGAGVNNLPLDKLAANGIVAFNTPGSNANGVKELVLCGMLLACRDILGGAAWVKAHAGEEDIDKKAEKEKKQFAGIEIAGKTLGIIGLGNIGRRLAEATAALGMKVIGFDPFLPADKALAIPGVAGVAATLEELYPQCDFLTLHLPLNADTRGMVDEKAFALMKDGAVLLNFSRGEIVDEKALADALQGKLRRYVTDFPNANITTVPGVIVLPHLGASTEESEDNSAVMAAEELKDYLEKGIIRCSVNYPALACGEKQAAKRFSLLYADEAAADKAEALLKAAGADKLQTVKAFGKGYGAAAVDCEIDCADALVSELETVPGMLKVRLL